MSLIIDATLAMAIGAIALVQADMQAVRTAQINTAVQTGQYMSGLQQAVNKYIAVNGDVLSGNGGSLTNPQGNAITIANPDAPTLAELQANGFLPTGYTTTNPSQLAFAVNITPTNCPGTGCSLPATVTSSQYLVNGQVRNDLLSYAVTAAGLDGGQSLAGNPGQYTSYGRTWTMPNGANKAGQLMMRAGVLTTGYVDTLPFYKLDGSRKLTGAMNANGQNITGANAVTANSVALPAGNSLTIAGVQVYGDGSNAAIRMPGALYLQGPNGAGAASLNAQDGNFSGNANVVGTMTANYATVNGNATVGGSTTVYGNSTVGGSQQVNGDQTTLGNQTINGVLTARNLVQLPALAWAGYGCSGNGVTTDPNGQLLSCQSGVWKAAGGGSVSEVASANAGGAGGDVQASVQCPGGTSVVSGGGVCNTTSNQASLWVSEPSGNGWLAACDGTGGGGTLTTTAIALCMAN
jgi:hypothetical protein